jgi:high-affinity nickel permease
MSAVGPGLLLHSTLIQCSTAIIVLPVLFAAGMSLVDTTDGVMILGAYDGAFVKPMRKLHYNMTIAWALSWIIYRAKRLDHLEVRVKGSSGNPQLRDPSVR